MTEGGESIVGGPMLNVREAAEILSLSEEEVLRRHRSLAGIPIGSRFYFFAKNVEAFRDGVPLVHGRIDRALAAGRNGK